MSIEQCAWILASKTVQGKRIGNLNIPAVLDYSVKVKWRYLINFLSSILFVLEVNKVNYDFTKF